MRRDAILERARILSKLILTDANYYLLSTHLSHPSSTAATEGWGTRHHFPPSFTLPPGFTFLRFDTVAGEFFREEGTRIQQHTHDSERGAKRDGRQVRR